MSSPPAGLSVRRQKGYGWRRDTPDMRDFLLAIAPPESLPAEASLRATMPPVYDQGQLGSCTACSIGALLEFNERKQLELDAACPSRLFIYYNERVMEGTVSEDAGAELRDGIKSVAQIGAPPEALWPYEVARFADRPPEVAYTEARKHQAVRYARVAQASLAMQTVIASGFGISFGFTVYTSFERDVAADGIVPMPQPGEHVLGGHAVVAMGYKPIGGQLYFECRNSWGADWGDHGYFWMPAAYLTSSSLAGDFWTVERVE